MITIPNLIQCDSCKGEGIIIDMDNKCLKCDSKGKISDDNTILLDCSKILTHSSIVYSHDGHYNIQSKTYSNVIIHLSSQDHKTFKRVDQLSISTIINISLPTALIGYTGAVTHPSGRTISFTTSSGIIEGEMCIIEGEGLSSNGDFIVIFKIIKTEMDVKMIDEVSKIFKKYNL